MNEIFAIEVIVSASSSILFFLVSFSGYRHKTRIAAAASVVATLALVGIDRSLWASSGSGLLDHLTCAVYPQALPCKHATPPVNKTPIALTPAPATSPIIRPSPPLRPILPAPTPISTSSQPARIVLSSPTPSPRTQLLVTNSAAPNAIPRLTAVSYPNDVAKVRRIWGLSLQWVDMSETPAQYGRAKISERNGYFHIIGEHKSAKKGARASIDGDIIRIDHNSIVIRGTIEIINSPNDEPNCIKSGDFKFEITYGRRYWRHYGGICSERKVQDDLDIYF